METKGGEDNIEKDSTSDIIFDPVVTTDYVSELWSLNKMPGYLRLTTAKVVSNLREARNTLTQRMFAYYFKTIPTIAVTKIEVDSMKDGDIAGLAVFQDPYAYIAVKQNNGSK